MGESRLRGEYAAVAAAGTTQSDATPMPAYTVMVTSGTGGVVLPPMNVTEEAIVCNGLSGADVYVYPRSGGKLNNATADLPVWTRLMRLDLCANSAWRRQPRFSLGSVSAPRLTRRTSTWR